MPALALGYLVAGPGSVLDRIWRLVLTLGAAVAAAGWWVLLVQLWPTDRRPWIGGTQHNSILELTLGYNGIGRLNGDEPGSVGAIGVSSPIHLGGRTSAHPWGQPGIGRLFEAAQIGCIGWLLPAALVFGLALLIWHARAPRRDLHARRHPGVGGVAADHGAGVQFHGRHLPSLLHRGAGPADRCAGGHRHAGILA